MEQPYVLNIEREPLPEFDGLGFSGIVAVVMHPASTEWILRVRPETTDEEAQAFAEWVGPMIERFLENGGPWPDDGWQKTSFGYQKWARIVEMPADPEDLGDIP